MREAGRRDGVQTHGFPASAALFEAKSRNRYTAPMLFAAVLCVRIVYVCLFASSTPFWDQWDAEADLLLRPWVEGTWTLQGLFSPHNEHRVVLSRLLLLLLFGANGQQWDNLVEACASAVVFAASMALLYALLCRGERHRSIRWAMFIVALVIAALPFGWENFLVGFQNQFYFMTAFALGSVGVVAYRPLGRVTLLVAIVLAVGSLFTMASGLVASVAALVVVLMRNLRERVRPATLLAFVACLGAVCLTGLLILPDVPPHAVFRANGVGEHLAALATILMWPLQPIDPASMHWRFYWRAFFALAMWTPAGIWLLRFARRRVATENELFAAGMAVWVLLQALAIAHSRGHEIVAVTSRYSEILAIGVLVNIWFALRMIGMASIGRRSSRRAWIGAAAYLVVVAYAFALRTPLDVRAMVDRSDAMKLQTRNVRAYVSSGDVRHLQQPFFQIPYPDAERLRSLLDNPTIRAMLPASIHAPLPNGAAAPVGRLSNDAQQLQRFVRNAVHLAGE
ncbi:MAG: hypothetical protein ABI843_05180 [Dokdonella sp.]